MTTLADRIAAGDRDAVLEAEAKLEEPEAGDDSAAALRRALVAHYTRADGARWDAGMTHLNRDYEAALRHMRALAAAAPDDPGRRFRLASLLLDTGRLDEAEGVLEGLWETSRGTLPQSDGLTLNILAGLARLTYLRGDFAGAAAGLDAVLARALAAFGATLSREEGRFLVMVLVRKARALVNAGDPAGAVAAIEGFPHQIRHPFLERTLNRARALLAGRTPSAQPDARPVVLDRLTVACVKHGPKYGPDYVNRLYSMVRRHLPGAWRFCCLTDDRSGLRPEAGIIDISSRDTRGWWAKLALFDPATPIPDETVLYLDLDTVITGGLGFIADLRVGFHIFEHPDVASFNSSVMLFDRGFATPVHERLAPEEMTRLPGDQDWIELCLPGLDTFRHGLIRLYRGLDPALDADGLAASGARIVTFPGAPKPHQIEDGWVTEHWR